MKKEPKYPFAFSETLDSSNYISNPNKKDQFPIVGIGASAGGVDALEQFFINMPADNKAGKMSQKSGVGSWTIGR